MKLQMIRCTQCGASFDDYDPKARVIKCKRMGCGALFVVEQGVEFASVEEQKALKIGDLRKAMERAIHSNNKNLIQSHATKIAAMLPYDFTANFWLQLLNVRLNDGHPDNYYQFLRANSEATSEELVNCAQYAVDNAVENDVKALCDFFTARLSKEAARERIEALRQRIPELRELNKESGEVFILSDDSGGALADALYKKLRESSVDCWSERKNIPKDVIGYGKRIDCAQEGCRVALIVATTTICGNSSQRKRIGDLKERGIPMLVVRAKGAAFTQTFKKLISGAHVYDFEECGAIEAAIAEIQGYLAFGENSEDLPEEPKTVRPGAVQPLKPAEFREDVNPRRFGVPDAGSISPRPFRVADTGDSPYGSDAGRTEENLGAHPFGIIYPKSRTAGSASPYEEKKEERHTPRPFGIIGEKKPGSAGAGGRFKKVDEDDAFEPIDPPKLIY